MAVANVLAVVLQSMTNGELLDRLRAHEATMSWNPITTWPGLPAGVRTVNTDSLDHASGPKLRALCYLAHQEIEAARLEARIRGLIPNVFARIPPPTT